MNLRPAPYIEPHVHESLNNGRVPIIAGNASTLPYHGWTMAGSMPARHIPQGAQWGGLHPHGLPVYLGRRHTTEHRLFYVYGNFAPLQGVAGDFVPEKGPLPVDFLSHRWLVDEPLKVVPFPEVEVVVNPSDPPTQHRVETLTLVDLQARVLYQDDVERVHSLRARLKQRDGTQTPLLWQAWIYQLSGQPHADFGWRLVNSDATYPEHRYDVESVSIRSGEFHSIDCARRFGFQETPSPERDATDKRLRWVSRLRGPTTMGDGQTIWCSGAIYGAPAQVPIDIVASPDFAGNAVVANMVARMRGPALCSVQRGVHDGTYLGLRRIPQLPITIDHPLASVTRDYVAFRDAPVQGYFSINPYLDNVQSPSQTGAQRVFGATKGGDIVASGNPLASWMLKHSLSEGLRPTRYYERDGSLVTAAEHPDLNLWSQNIHGWPKNIDSLGKSPLKPGGVWYAEGGSYGWRSADDQHFRYLDTDAAYLATGRYEIRQLVKERVLTLEARYADGSARGIGRTFQSMANIARLLGGTKADHMVARMLRDLTEKGVFAAAQSNATWLFREIHTDSRVLTNADGTPVRAAMVWQQGLEILGIRALHLLMVDLAHPRVGEVEYVLYRLCTALLAKGWFRRQTDGLWQLADAVAWNDGELIPDSSYGDGNVPGLVHTTGWFQDWNHGGTTIAKNVLQARIDEAKGKGLQPTDRNVQLVSRAQAILLQMGAPRSWESAEWRAAQ